MDKAIKNDFNIIDYLVKLPEGAQDIIINKEKALVCGEEFENIKTWGISIDGHGNRTKYINGRKVK